MSGSEDKINIVVVWRVQSVARLVGGLWRRGHEVLPIVEKTSLGNNCKDYFGMTGLVAALEKGRLVVVKRDCLASGRHRWKKCPGYDDRVTC